MKTSVSMSGAEQISRIEAFPFRQDAVVISEEKFALELLVIFTLVRCRD